MMYVTQWEVSVHGPIFLVYDVVETSESGKYIMAYCDVSVVGNSQDPVIVRDQIHPLPES
jgi:hypothetical protein